ncbi:MAG: hypothetical protein ABIW46_05065, partial [Acidimicrobiales bacterium]
MPDARLLVVMGSGETAPTMVTVHQKTFARLGDDVPTALLETPYGFQANADDLSARARTYFEDSVGRHIDVCRFRSKAAAAADPVAHEQALDDLRAAQWVFAGPGSPSYALRQWAGTPVPQIMAERLAKGGAVTFASAAALTLGVVTVPVYEVYKVGEEPRWLDGLDLLGTAAGLRCALIPHYDNAEGGTHDTRFCYLGESRLAAIEPDLPEGAFVLGVDEHTALVLDLGAGTATVQGRGTITVRLQGRSTVFPVGTVLGIDELRAIGEGRDPAPGGSGRSAASRASAADEPATDGSATDGSATDGSATRGSAAGGSAADRPVGGSDTGRSPGVVTLSDTISATEAAFSAAIEARDATAAVAAALELETAIAAWSADTLQSDEMDRARAALRGMITRLGRVAGGGLVDRRV